MRVGESKKHTVYRTCCIKVVFIGYFFCSAYLFTFPSLLESEVVWSKPMKPLTILNTSYLNWRTYGPTYFFYFFHCFYIPEWTFFLATTTHSHVTRSDNSYHSRSTYAQTYISLCLSLTHTRTDRQSEIVYQPCNEQVGLRRTYS